MSSTVEAFNPYKLTVGTNEIADLRERFDNYMHGDTDNPCHGQIEFITRLLEIATSVLEEQGPEVKKPIIVSGNRPLYSAPNCTDTACAQLQVIEAMGGMTAFAAFDGVHASVLATARDGGYLSLYNGNPSKVAEYTPKKREVNTAFERTAAAMRKISKTEAQGALVLNMGVNGSESNDKWIFRILHTDEIRAESTRIVRSNETIARIGNFVIVSTPLAYVMLRAIDVLDTLGERAELSPEYMEAYCYAKLRLARFIPRLSADVAGLKK